ncbi:molybdopterin-containing oxidoreductase family protein [Desulfitobacterium sp. AusDCA]|uniref:molybdopterin-containing oxidoreductase family protein n=1 Tax=Desulfitobacterium sp. AusDCA TaxID=3240383 RepID=UPI003DA75696
MSHKIVRTSCRMCHGVCQVLVHLDNDKVVKVTGDPESPTSKGYICSKAIHSPELLYHPDRLTEPLERIGKRGENKWKAISWQEALDKIAEKLDSIRKEYGSEYVALTQGTGRPYTIFNARFANAFGTPNFVTSSHICFFSRVTSSGITLGGLPISDIYGFGGVTPKCMLIWGCNIFNTGGADGMSGGMLRRAINHAQNVIVIDPRKTLPNKPGVRHLQLKPGTDGALALALVHVIISEDLIDKDFVQNYTFGYDELVQHIQPYTPEWASEITELDAETIKDVARTYAIIKPASIQWGNGIDYSLSAFQTARAILILRGITGNIDKPGGDVLWVSPEKIRVMSPLVGPEGIGARFLPQEKQSLSLNEGKYPFDPFIHPPTFWKSILEEKPYRVKALWAIGTNPLVTATNPAEIKKALDLIDFIVVSDFFLTPTAQQADIVLPAATWLEQNDIANFHKIWAVLARKKVAQVGNVKDDKEIILELAKRLGLQEAFPWSSLEDYREWILENTELNFDEFCEKGIITGNMEYFKYRKNGFPTPSGKFELYSHVLESMNLDPLPIYRDSSLELTSDYPLWLTNAKTLEFFHSENRNLPSLRQKNPDPLVEINSFTASEYGIANEEWVILETVHGKVRMRVKTTTAIKPNVICAQHGWWFPEEDNSENSWQKSNVNMLYAYQMYDPEIGAELMRGVPCKIYRE